MPESSRGQYFEGPQDDSRISLASAARTATADGTAFATENIDEIEAELIITAVDGTDPTLDVVLQTTTDDGDYYTVGSFPQQTTTTEGVGRVFTGLGASCRWSWTIGGTDTPSFTFSVAAESEKR